jgi:hypothetical protein
MLVHSSAAVSVWFGQTPAQLPDCFSHHVLCTSAAGERIDTHRKMRPAGRAAAAVWLLLCQHGSCLCCTAASERTCACSRVWPPFSKPVSYSPLRLLITNTATSACTAWHSMQHSTAGSTASQQSSIEVCRTLLCSNMCSICPVGVSHCL